MKDQDGATLVEVLVTTVILALIIPVIMSTFITGLRATEGTADRLSASADAKIAGANLVPDIQSADTVSATTAACASGVAGTHVLSLSWTEGTVAVDVTYQEETSGTKLLRRYECRNAVVQAGPATVMRSVATGVSVTCTPSCATKGRTVTVDADSCIVENGACASDSLYAFQVKATSRDAA